MAEGQRRLDPATRPTPIIGPRLGPRPILPVAANQNRAPLGVRVWRTACLASLGLIVIWLARGLF